MNTLSLFRLDSLSSFVVLAIAVFSLLIGLYSLSFMRAKQGAFQYFLWMILSALASLGVVLANNFILLLVCWGFLGFSLFILINMGGEKAVLAAKKSFIIIGGTDALLLFGIAIIYYLSGTFSLDSIRLDLNNPLAVSAYLCIAMACFAKAGLMPFHSWIPDCAESAPVPVVAFLPASLDKLLGIYLLTRASLHLFVMSQAMNIFLMVMGAFTIIAAVMMALVQHNMKRLLGYHAVSQVGYMVLGIGTGNPIGIAGGLFHMLNHTIYKSSLFLVSGNVEERTKTTELDALGGLSKLMPLTYISCLIASLSISGVPPFNGFFSKWMIYQGLVDQLHASSYGLRITCALCLLAAMFGSGLTLASFMKLIHATFLGQRSNWQKEKEIKEVNWMMWLPCLILALLCIVFGVFALALPLKYFIFPALGQGMPFIGTWYAGIASLLIIIALILGAFFMRLKIIKPVLRQDIRFVGGEAINFEENRVTGTDFYNTVKEYGLLSRLYKKAEKGAFDIYEQGKKFLFLSVRPLQNLHNGILPTYLVWCLLGLVILFFLCVGR